jgi:hypothetical protein
VESIVLLWSMSFNICIYIKEYTVVLLVKEEEAGFLSILSSKFLNLLIA